MNASTPKSVLSRRVLWAALAVSVAACSFIVNFDPNGQPCSTNPTARCLAGYYCDTDAGLCRPGNAPPPADAGPCGGACTPGQRCLTNRNLCVNPDSCQALPCSVGFQCDMPDASFFDASFPDSGPFDASVRDAGAFDAGPINYCAPSAEAVGTRCLADADCMFVGQFCVLSSAYQQFDSGVVGPGSGFCTQLCTPTSLCPTGSTCVQLPPTSHGMNAVSLCLVDVTQSKTDPLQLAPLQCQREGDCLDFPGLTCTVFDSAALPDAVSFCDTAVPGGVNNGAACHRSSKPLAANGLCLPQGAVTGEADAVCTTSADCEVGNCLVSEFLTGAANANGIPIVRAVGACYSKPPSTCAVCATATDCSADAPHCVGADAGICRMACTSSTSCPSGHTCDDAGYCGCP